MTTVVNGNLWIYFAHTDVDERVICKICKRSLMSKRSFNLRKHLKHSHKIEVRQERKVSHLKHQQIAPSSSHEGINTSTGVNFWSYFTKTERADRVTCKICKSYLKSNHGYNLRQHLKYSHQIEVRMDRRLSKRKKQQLLTSSNECAKINEYSLLKTITEDSIKNNVTGTNDQMLDSHDSQSRLSCSIDPTSPTIAEIKEEYYQDFHENGCKDVIEPEQAFEVSSNCENEVNNAATALQNSSIPPLYYPSAKPDNFPPNTIIPIENIRIFEDPLIGSNLLTNGNDFEQSSDKKKINSLADDESSTASNKKCNFEQWFNKKMKLLQVEEFQMRNYKLKLELWEKEQQLNLSSSKFTRDMRINQ